MQVWAVEGVALSLLQLLDVSTLDSTLQAIQESSALQGYLKDSSLWKTLLQLHFNGDRDPELRYLALPTRDRGWDWTSRDRTCIELQEFLLSADEKTHFDKTVRIVEGDIGYINDIDGKPLDGIAFPTNSHLTNHYVGAAQAVFRRAGRGLTDHVNDPSFRGRRPTGSAIATPAFDARVRTLIHCVGPRITMPNCFELLATTYENAMSTISHEQLTCVTMASISTGNMGVPCDLGAQVALRAIQKFLRANHWEGSLAIVCYEKPVLEAFSSQKLVVLEQFNTIPALPVLEEGRFPQWPF
ncbi:Ganglioside-induced differentiation-associated protein 2 [Phytophthora boehmeriae]|uniref:Ganglioside-induced differentiation-associated protein 2 n=1 Tax=Phytophthora boehmeriae TaxID=109152 RepID=A0A8T1V7B7_9STRA|nr:Ganglioside-induced differentiation-associated protein 2 [Phytophthora boehmeriae]